MIDLIIVNYKSTDFLLSCLDSIYDRRNGFRANVHVVDNGPGEFGFLVKSIYPETNIIINDANLGFSKAVNKVLKKTSSPYVIILNPDTIVYENFFESIIGFIKKHPEVGITGPKILNPDGSTQGSARAFPNLLSAFFGRRSILTKWFPNSRLTAVNILSQKSNGQTPMEVDWISGACMVVRRRAIEQVGMLDERFFLYWEDVDWCKRMWQKGWKVIYLPVAVIQHGVGGSSERNLVRSTFEFHKSAYLFYKKYRQSYRLIWKPVAFCALLARFCGILPLRVTRRLLTNALTKYQTVRSVFGNLDN